MSVPSEQRLRRPRRHRVRPQVRHLQGGRGPKVEDPFPGIRLSFFRSKFGPLDEDVFRRAALLHRADGRWGDAEGRLHLSHGRKFNGRVSSGSP